MKVGITMRMNTSLKKDYIEFVNGFLKKYIVYKLPRKISFKGGEIMKLWEHKCKECGHEQKVYKDFDYSKCEKCDGDTITITGGLK